MTMSYLETKISRKQFIRQSGKSRTQKSCAMALSTFDKFCKAEYHGKDGDEILSEVQVAIKQHGQFF